MYQNPMAALLTTNVRLTPDDERRIQREVSEHDATAFACNADK